MYLVGDQSNSLDPRRFQQGEHRSIMLTKGSRIKVHTQANVIQLIFTSVNIDVVSVLCITEETNESYNFQNQYEPK